MKWVGCIIRTLFTDRLVQTFERLGMLIEKFAKFIKVCTFKWISCM